MQGSWPEEFKSGYNGFNKWLTTSVLTVTLEMGVAWGLKFSCALSSSIFL